ncbi:MAG: pantetheine-phosphate adenylyltransferase [Hyphomicrobiaceae bacterium]|nr:pantetheine-phosphate adenylyltransferase [Hyphomicrobiaceae bacterium]
MAQTGFYPGSFDPLTLGHMDIIVRAAKFLDRLVIAVGLHHGKKPLFSVEDRVDMIKAEVAALIAETGTDIEVQTFDKLTVDAARAVGANVIIRGLRDSGDFDYEMQMAGMNGTMAPDIETVFLASSPPVRHIAGTLVRQIASMGGEAGAFVPQSVATRLNDRFGRS